jgi:hypothetical protein
MESFDRFQLAGLALICLKNEAKADAEREPARPPFYSRHGCSSKDDAAKGYCAT